MQSFSDYVAQGHAWLFLPAAVVLGALHGLEPGHSKTMMAAFIVAVRGTVAQAALLGLSATVSHTAIIWILAFVGLHYSGRLNVEELEPYFQVATGVIVVGLAAWMFWRTRRAQLAATSHDHDHGPHGGVMVDIGDGLVEISVFETNVSPRFRLYFFGAANKPENPPANQTVTLETVRPDGATQRFEFTRQGEYLEATAELPEPHEFEATLKLEHAGHVHTFQTEFIEDHHHHHDKSAASGEGGEHQDAHERAHAREFTQRFANRNVTTGQIVLFGLTGGLLPCPSAFAVLLVCLQLKQFSLGFALVLAFSLGLAMTLVAVGVVAALSVRHATKRFKGFGEFARKMPYVSSIVMVLIGFLVAIQGVRHLAH
jgi:nickel/cobalt exporter